MRNLLPGEIVHGTEPLEDGPAATRRREIDKEEAEDTNLAQNERETALAGCHRARSGREVGMALRSR
jgi:hypothetical protein